MIEFDEKWARERANVLRQYAHPANDWSVIPVTLAREAHDRAVRLILTSPYEGVIAADVAQAWLKYTPPHRTLFEDAALAALQGLTRIAPLDRDWPLPIETAHLAVNYARAFVDAVKEEKK